MSQPFLGAMNPGHLVFWVLDLQQDTENTSAAQWTSTVTLKVSKAELQVDKIAIVN